MGKFIIINCFQSSIQALYGHLLGHLSIIVFVHFLKQLLYLRLLPQKFLEREKPVKIPVSGAEEVVHLLSRMGFMCQDYVYSLDEDYEQYTKVANFSQNSD